jgi:hypothetical protein
LRSGVRGGLGGVARGKAGEAFGVDVLVAVDEGGGDLLGHAFEEGLHFGEAELRGVAVEVGDVLVDDRVGFEVAAGIDDLSGGGLGVGNALVEQAPSGLGRPVRTVVLCPVGRLPSTTSMSSRISLVWESSSMMLYGHEK